MDGELQGLQQRGLAFQTANPQVMPKCQHGKRQDPRFGQALATSTLAPQDSLVVFVKAFCKTGIPWRPAAR